MKGMMRVEGVGGGGGLEQITEELRLAFRSGRTRGAAWRKSQLRALLQLITDHEDKIFEALMLDLGKHPVEAFRDEIGVVEKSRNQPTTTAAEMGQGFLYWSASVARIVMSAAAKHLTPVTTELGGKCPVIFDHLSIRSNTEVAVKRVVGGKLEPCNGQACIGADYVLVEEQFAYDLIEMLKKTIKKFYGANPKPLKNISRIVNERHFQRLSNLLKYPAVAASIVHGGLIDEDQLSIEPTIL